jgi:hypothetical protein
MKEISKYLLKFVQKEFETKRNETLDVLEHNTIPVQFIEGILSELQRADTAWKKEHIEHKDTHLSKGDSFHHIPSDVRTIIETRQNIGREYRFSIHAQNIVTHLVYPFAQDDPVDKMSPVKIDAFFTDCLRKIYLWLYIAYNQKPPSCSRQLDIYIYFSELFKVLPETKREPIGQTHANTAFTTSCRPSTTIHVYREEEWFKVFIHESFHCLGFDFSHSDVLASIAKEQVLAIYPVTSDVNLFETYCETFAELLNVIFYVYLNDTHENLDHKVGKIHQYMVYESIFTCFQCAKVLHFYGLTYENLYHSDKKSLDLRTRYHENTNVLAYYIIKAVYMTHLSTFFHWFSYDNGDSFVFKETPKNILSYCDILRVSYSDPSFLSIMKYMETWLSRHHGEDTLENRTLRMTVIE